jgi:hypothetical protein
MPLRFSHYIHVVSFVACDPVVAFATMLLAPVQPFGRFKAISGGVVKSARASTRMVLLNKLATNIRPLSGYV